MKNNVTSSIIAQPYTIRFARKQKREYSHRFHHKGGFLFYSHKKSLVQIMLDFLLKNYGATRIHSQGFIHGIHVYNAPEINNTRLCIRKGKPHT